ncbi:hypothetical protein JXC34_00830 [Candidatus Woesearchaeota archaeon]|nr:hypothetical protein [Candidatus Woesearchaeota archaeon]
MTQDRKAQISFEFIIIFSLVFFVLVAFIYIMNNRMSEIYEQQDELAMRALANSIKNEVVLASSVNNNYLRKFEIPTKINSRDYRIEIEDLFINIYVLENNKTVNEFFSILSIPVKGNFFENINSSTNKHCITKNNYDGVRISLNQASLDTNATEFKSGDIFEVIFSLNCVENIRTVRFTVRYEPDNLEFVDVDSIYRDARNGINPLFEKKPRPEINYSDVAPLEVGNEYYDLVEPGRFTFSFVGSETQTGSGSIAKLFFKVISNDTTKTKIDFDSRLQGQELVVLDITTNKFTKEGIPETRQGVEVELN